jgi:signal transduction histidine kinase/uncharacterized protein YigA (DUF484 family)
MANSTQVFAGQLKQTCKLTGTCWAVWLHRSQKDWEFQIQLGLGKARRAALTEFIRKPHIAVWLAGALSSTRTRYHSAGESSEELKCQRVYAFPCARSQCLLLVGSDNLKKEASGFFHVLTSSYSETVSLSRVPASEQESLRTAVDQGVFPNAEENLDDENFGRYFQQFALLSDLASDQLAVSDLEETARRIVRRLRRTFHTDLVAVVLPTGDGKSVSEYGCEPAMKAFTVPIGTSLVGYVYETGVPVCVGDIQKAPRFLDEKRRVCSALVVPMKYNKQTVGAIAVESTEPDAFTQQDKQLLMVIASYMAGLLEYVRLNQETLQRASNLELIHQVVESIVGLTEEDEIAQKTTELVAAYFGFELALVFLLDEARHKLVNIGAGGKFSRLAPVGSEYPVDQGITGRVIRTGESDFSDQAERDPSYVSFLGTPAGSEMCIPLKNGERVFGGIYLEREQTQSFSSKDLPMLESLAGILSAVMLKARGYRELKVSVGHLQAVRETALDISWDLDQNALFRRVIHRVRELTHARGVLLGLLDEERQVLRIVQAENPWRSVEGLTVPLGQGILGQVVRTGQATFINDYNDWEDRLQIMQSWPFNVVVGVPLIFRGEVIGAMVAMDNRPEHNLTKEDLNLLELLAPEVAVSIHNARIYKELEERIQSQRLTERKLIRSAQLAAVGEMAAGVAHELNNPMTTIAGFVSLALEELPKDLPQREELEIVLSEAHRAQRVIRGMLDFARQGENVRALTGLNHLTQEVLALIQHQVQTETIQLETDFCEDLPVVYVDPSQIKQVFLNLIQNALQSMPEGGALRLTTAVRRRDGIEGAIFSVQDSGEGIPEEIQDRVFDPFFTTRPVGSGTGLGLSVSYGIVTDHNGHIDFESQVGEGSCFTVWLPVAEDLMDD